MEIKINLDQLQPDTMRCECPTCKKDVDAIVVNEYDFYYDLYHAECSTEWRFSSYEQCIKLKELNLTKIIHRIKYEGEGSFERNLFGSLMKVSAFIGLGMLTGGAAVPLIFITLGANKVGNMWSEQIRKTQIKNADYAAYNIDDFFKELHLHHFEKKYVEERESNLRAYDAIINTPPEIACS